MENKSTNIRYLSLAVVLATSFATAQTPSPVVSIALTMKDTNIKAGDKIWVQVVTTNQSDHAVAPGYYPGPLEGPEFSTRSELLDSQGKQVPLKPLEKYDPCNGDPRCVIPPPYYGSFVRVLVEPKASYKNGFLLSDLYDVSKPGSYTIQAFRKDKTGQTDKSNVLTFTVTP